MVEKQSAHIYTPDINHPRNGQWTIVIHSTFVTYTTHNDDFASHNMSNGSFYHERWTIHPD